MAWTIVAKGKNFDDLKVVKNINLPPGTKVRCEMQVSPSFLDKLFDAPGVEHLFAVPDGMKMVDVYGENGKGIVLLEVESANLSQARLAAWPVAVGIILAVMKSKWFFIVLGTFLLSYALHKIVSSIVVLADIVGAGAVSAGAIILILLAVAILAPKLARKRSPP